jgi:hypothetical protein
VSADSALTVVGGEEDAESARLRHGRSKATNNVDQLPGVKMTLSTARRFRDLMSAFLVDQGGVTQCSEIRLALLRRLASVVVQAELIEARMLNGEQVDAGLLCQLASTVVRLSTRLGIERIPREIEPSLNQYLAERYDKYAGEDAAS